MDEYAIITRFVLLLVFIYNGAVAQVHEKHLGCYSLIGTDSIEYDIHKLALPRVLRVNVPLAIEICIELCYTRGYSYMGRRWDNCFCGNNVSSEAKVADSDCDYKCNNGDANLPCGGYIYASIYKAEPKDDRLIGCYKGKSGGMFALPWWPFAQSDGSLTVEKCISQCFAYTFKYAALSKAFCYCGNNMYDQFGAVAVCDSSCSGDNSQVCGRFSSVTEDISVYQTNAKPPDDRYVGCYRDHSGLLQVYEATDATQMTVEVCISRCNARDFTDAALQSGHYCSCGNGPVTTPVISTVGCDTPCPGNASETCGGSSTLSVFRAVCRPGTFDSGCEEQCHCVNQQVCDVTDGGCPGECAPGWTGMSCQQKCSEGTFGLGCANPCHCNSDVLCDPVNGHCADNRCIIGYTGANCSQVCSHGFFGEACSFRCHCLESAHCDIIDGTCINGQCEAGWMASNCSVGDEGLNGDKSLTPVIIGAVLGAIALMAIIVILFVFLKRRKGKNGDKEEAHMAMVENGGIHKRHNAIDNIGLTSQSSGEQSVDDLEPEPEGADSVQQNETLEDQNESDLDIEDKGTIKEPEMDVYENFIPIKKPIKLEDLKDYVSKEMQKPEPFKEEYTSIPHGLTAKCGVGGKDAIRKLKNRFKNIIAFDHSRVKLKKVRGQPYSDYINANYIKDYRNNAVYIAAQGPMPETLEDFWRMLWEQNAPNIVMVTNAVELGKNKCEKYWPEAGEESYYGDIKVILQREEEWPDYYIRVLAVNKESTDELRSVKQFHFTRWPDHGIPTYATPLLNFLRKVKSHLAPEVGPTVVHCSAGVGRTGTFLALDHLLDQAKSEMLVDIYSCVSLLRSDRVNMVQTLDQYIFIHSAILEAVTVGDTTIPCYRLIETLKELIENSPYTDTTRIQEQFKMLEFLKPSYHSSLYASGKSEENICRNRSKDILPAQMHRVLTPTREAGDSDYINAVFVNGYREKNTFIVTQLPLSKTQEDFWQMVTAFNCHIIVSLHHLDESPDCIYWPNQKEAMTLDDTVVSCTKVSKEGNVNINYLKIIHKGETHDVILYHYDLDISDEDNKGIIVQNLFTIHDLVKRTQQKKGRNPIVTQCFYGSERSGVFCAVSCLLDMMNAEQEVDVFRIVQHIRTSRPQFISDIDQFDFLYQVALRYLDNFDQYANFK